MRVYRRNVEQLSQLFPNNWDNSSTLGYIFTCRSPYVPLFRFCWELSSLSSLSYRAKDTLRRALQRDFAGGILPSGLP